MRLIQLQMKPYTALYLSIPFWDATMAHHLRRHHPGVKTFNSFLGCDYTCFFVLSLFYMSTFNSFLGCDTKQDKSPFPSENILFQFLSGMRRKTVRTVERRMKLSIPFWDATNPNYPFTFSAILTAFNSFLGCDTKQTQARH